MPASKDATNGSPRGRILIVGAGYGGLGVAIELTRKGFEVEVLEAVPQLTTQGLLSLLQFAPSVQRKLISSR